MRKRAAVLAQVLSVVLAVVATFVVLALGVAKDVPVGGVSGRILMGDSGKGLPQGEVTLEPLGVAPVEGAQLPEDRIRDRSIETDGEGRFRLSGLRAGFYRIRASGEHHNTEVQTVEVVEGKSTAITLKAEPEDPSLEVYVAQKNILPGEKARVEIHGFSPDRALQLQLRRIPVGTILAKGGIRQVLSPLSRNEANDLGIVVRQVSVELTQRDAEGGYVQPTELPPLEAGLYWAEFRGEKIRKGTYVNVTELGMVTKFSPDSGLTYVANLVSGKPVAGADLRFEANGQMRTLGTTGESGIVQAVLDLSKGGVLVARRGDSTALVDFYQRDLDPQQMRIVTYTERPVYRPGDTIQFKSLVRKVGNGLYSLPEDRSATVTFLNETGQMLARKTLSISDLGALHGEFRTNAEDNPGSYQIQVKVGEFKESHYVTLLAYRKPEFTVNVKLGKDAYIIGEKASATIECQTYFGAAVAGAKVNVSVYRSTIWSDPDSEEYWSDSYGDYLETIELTTDATGRAYVSVDTRRPGDPDRLEQDYEIRFEAMVNENDRYFEGKGSAKLLRGTVTIIPSFTESFVVANKALRVGATVRESARPEPVADARVKFDLVRRTWNPDKVREEDEVLTSAEGQTDEQGLALAELTPPKPGSYEVVMTATDPSGRVVSTSRSVWVEGASTYEGNDTPISVTLDKYSGEPETEVKALIQTPNPGGSALLTVEGARIYSAQLVALDKPSTVLKLKLDPRAVPNAFVCVTYVRDRKFASSERRVQIKTTQNELAVAVKADRERVKPGEFVSYRVTTKGPSGQPVSAEVSLGVVDEAIYAIRPEDTDLKGSFYPTTWNQVETSHSFEEIYLDGGDKGGTNVKIRRDFRDTAFWAPTVRTNANGEAAIRVKLPDNLTTWRATAVAITERTEVGMGVAKIVAAKDLNVRIQSPRYLVVGDDRSMTVVINNETDRAQDVNFEVDASPELTLRGEAQGRRRIEARQATTLEFQVSGTRGTGALVAKAWVSGGPNDGVEAKLPVMPAALPARWGRSVPVSDEARIELPDSATDGALLDVKITPSVATALYQSLDDLVGFPYGCVEQTMSRFLPSILVGDMLRDLGVEDRDLQAKIPRIAADGLARLAKMQHSDGGWGWWENDESDPFMTALVLDGLQRASAMGYNAPAIRQSQAVERARALAKETPTWRPDEMNYLAWVLARYNERAAAELILQRPPKTITGWAYRALTLHALKREGDAAEALARMRALIKASRVTEEPWGAEPEAISLLALVTMLPNSPETDSAAEALMRKRQGDMWFSTRDTAFSILGLSQYVRQANERPASGTVTLEVDGKAIGTVSLTGRSFFEPAQTVRVPLTAAAKQLIVRSDTGTRIRADVTVRGFETLQQATTGDFTIDQKLFRLETARTAEGRLEVRSAGSPVTVFKAGDLLRAEVTITTKVARQFLLVEAFTPSNCSVVEREGIGSDEEWGWWYSAITVKDDRVAFFIRDLQPGTHTLVFHLRAEGPGRSILLPPMVANMYDPSERANGTLAEVRVNP